MVIWILAKKDLRLLLRDRRAVIILLAMPFIFILVLGLSLGAGFGQKPDDRLRVSMADLDHGSPEASPVPDNEGKPEKWSKIVQLDLANTAGIRVEIIPSREEADQL